MQTLFGRGIIHKKNRIIISVRSYFVSVLFSKKQYRHQKSRNLMLISNPLKRYKKVNLKTVRGSRIF
jgi:hypothetical protein